MPTPADNEATLREMFLPIPDPHERLSAIVDACSGPGIPESGRLPDDIVPGCVSRVWLKAETAGETLRFRWEADSAIVRGLVGLLCQVYERTRPEDARRHRSAILSSLGLDRLLSPTRLRGLASVEQRIHGLAAEGRQPP